MKTIRGKQEENLISVLFRGFELTSWEIKASFVNDGFSFILESRYYYKIIFTSLPRLTMNLPRLCLIF